jgi:hypothetical protein
VGVVSSVVSSIVLRASRSTRRSSDGVGMLRSGRGSGSFQEAPAWQRGSGLCRGATTPAVGDLVHLVTADREGSNV